MGLEVFHRFAWQGMLFFQVAPGICVSDQGVFEPQAVALAPGVSLIFLVAPGHHITYKGLPITWPPLDVGVEVAKRIYSVAAVPRRGALKQGTYISLCEMLDDKPFVSAYHRALAAHGPLAPIGSRSSRAQPSWRPTRSRNIS